MSLSSGARLGPYEIQAAIGAGGTGEVYKARDTRLDRSVAIKVQPPQFSAEPERRARFEREAKTIAGLSHPHICTLFDVGDHEGSTFLVMEHLTGETLVARLEKGPLPLDQALTTATEIADALSAAHLASASTQSTPLTGEAGRRRMMAVEFAPGSPPLLGRPRELFSFDQRDLQMACNPIRCDDVAADRQRFYVLQRGTPPPRSVVTHINLVLNWLEELKAKVPTGR